MKKKAEFAPLRVSIGLILNLKSRSSCNSIRPAEIK
ncbi:MAG: hypothetical protein RIR26_2422, partial [Pseudomonadota bacterium]